MSWTEFPLTFIFFSAKCVDVLCSFKFKSKPNIFTKYRNSQRALTLFCLYETVIKDLAGLDL